MADSSKQPDGLPRPGPLDADNSGESFDFGDLTRSHQETLLRSRRRRRSPLRVVVVAVLALALIGGALALWLNRKQPLVLRPIDNQMVDELSTLELTVGVQNPGKRAGRLKYTLQEAPEGAQIDAASGQFRWTPTEEQGPDLYEMTVRVEAPGTKAIPAQQSFKVAVQEVRQPPVLEPIEEKTVEAGTTLAFQVRAEDRDVPSRGVRYGLARNAPLGASVDAKSGRFEWTPQDAHAGRVHEITVVALKAVKDGPTAERTFRVRVDQATAPTEDPDQLIDRFVRDLREEEIEVEASGDVLSHPPLSGKLRVLSIDGQRVGLFGYGAAEEAERDAQALAPKDLQPYTKPPPEPASAYLFQHDRLIAFYVGGDATLLNLLDGRLGRPVVKHTVQMTLPAEKTPGETARSAEEQASEIVLGLFDKNKLLSKTEYPTLRKVFADRFEREHQEQIEQVFGGPDDEIRTWLEDHVDIKEELYLAIDPEHDNVVRALQLFMELKNRFPEKFESYANLAIAVAVVWDDERRAIHGSPRGQHKSLQPEGEVGPIENFQYLLDTETVMQGRAQFLPWEFLVHLVNHRTPLAERHWALTVYLPKRVMFGKCYGDVPYDGGMLDGLDPKLKDKPHTLPNLLRFGGVCTARADFAGRVGKCLGVPAFSVGGKSRYGEGHGWVMWVELGRVTPTGFTFSLESHGRFRGDRYYVGHLNDPHTGERTSDRDLERRLHTVGMDPIAKRQADLVMRIYPVLRERTEMDTLKQLAFLTRVIDFSPGNEEAWIALAKMSREGQITKTNSKPMIRVLEHLFTTFAAMPDFTWVVFDDLISFQDLPKQRAALFGRLAALYEQAGRPDLSCEARLKYAEYLVADERLDEAIQGLTVAILLFPEEGNFVPKMLDKLEALCQEHGKAREHLVGFYQQFLPKISRLRLGRPSPYCMQMYRRGIERFEEAGQDQLAQLYQAQLAALEAQKP